MLVELDLSQPLPDKIAIDCIECSIIQPILYKHLPNSCFHCGKQDHIIRNCPIKNPHIILPQANEKSQANIVNLETNKPIQQDKATPQKEAEFTTIQMKKKANRPNKPQPVVKANRYYVLATIPDPEEEEEAADIVMNTPLDKQRIGKEVDNLDAIDTDPPHNLAPDKNFKNLTSIPQEMQISKELKRNRAQLGSTPLSAVKGGNLKPPNKR